MSDYGETINLNKEPLKPLPENDWPSMAKVEAQYPQLCSEEQVWILDALISEVHRLKNEQRDKK